MLISVFNFVLIFLSLTATVDFLIINVSYYLVGCFIFLGIFIQINCH